RRQLESITETMPAAVAHFSRDCRYLWANPSYAARCNRKPEELIGEQAETILGPAAWGIKRTYVTRVLAGERVDFEALIPIGDTEPRWYHSEYMPIVGEDGTPDGWVAVIMDITHYKKLQEALKETDRRKDAFIAVLAHELRNPLAPIRNALEIMQMTGADGHVQADARDVIERQLRQMVRLLQDLLDISRISRGKIVLRRQRVALKTILESAVETSQPLIDAGRHRLTLSLPHPAVLVYAAVTRTAPRFSN